MICKIGLCLAVALLVATCTDAIGIRQIRNKYKTPATGSATASAAAGSNGVGGSAAAAAAAGFGYQGGYPPNGPYHAPPQQQYFYPGQYAEPHYVQSRRPSPTYFDGGLIPESSYAAPVFAPQPQFYPGQGRPSHLHQQAGPYGFRKGSRQHAPEFDRAATSSAATAAAVAGGRNGAGAASAATAGHSGGGAALAAASAAASAGHRQQHYAPEHDYHSVDEEGYGEHYYEPETEEHYQASAGTYNGPNNHFEQGSYARQTESVSGHEDGREDSDHYYSAQASSKAADENNFTAYNNADSEVNHTKDGFHKKKSKVSFVQSSNKRHTESGSGVVAHDKHSAAFNKDFKKLLENVDQRFAKGADGLVQHQNSRSSTNIEDEDEMYRDSRGTGFVPPKTPQAGAAAAAAASASFSGHRR